jgi:hypothetical protein
MNFRYRDAHGKTVELPDVASLLEAIREGDVVGRTPLSVGDDRSWHRADSTAVYRESLAALARSGEGPPSGTIAAAVPTRSTTPWHRRREVRIAAVVAAVAVVLLGAGLRIRHLDRDVTAERRAGAEAAHASKVRQAAGTFSTEAADSAAAAIGALQKWVRRQRFDQRLHGAALRNPSSLSEVRAAAAAWSIRVDSLLAGAGALAARLTGRADSMETGTPGLDGLGTATEDALSGWGQELAGYIALERNGAAALDSVAEFALERQASFVVREGEPVFLSRADGVRFRQLFDHLADLAGREKSWAQVVLGRRPDWMAALPDAVRPVFGEPVVRAP